MEVTRSKTRKGTGHGYLKTSIGADFAAKLGPLKIGKEDGDDKELKALRCFFKSAPTLMSMAAEPTVLASFAALAFGDGLRKGAKPLDRVDRMVAKFVLKLRSRVQARRCAEHLPGLSPESTVCPYSSSKGGAKAFSGGGLLRLPPLTYALPSAPSTPRCPDAAGDATQSPTKGVRDAVSVRELREARAPVPMSLRDFPRATGHSPRRDKKAGAHYDYFARCLPDESPGRRQLLRDRVLTQRKACDRPLLGTDDCFGLDADSSSPAASPRRAGAPPARPC